jgi:hypothetical protein
MDNYFSSTALFDDLCKRKVNCCGRVCATKKHASQFWAKVPEHEERCCNIIGVKEPEGCMLGGQTGGLCTDQHLCTTSREGRNLLSLKTAILIWVIWTKLPDVHQLQYVQDLKWTEKLFFHHTYLVIVSALIIHRSCGGTVTHMKSREQLIKDLIHLLYDQNVTNSQWNCLWKTNCCSHSFEQTK